MKKTNDSAKLQNAILILESQQADRVRLLKERYHETVNNITPASILKNTLKEVTTTSFIVDKVLNASIGLVGGYISNKIAVGGSKNKVRQLFGKVVQFEVSNIIAQHPEIIKAIGLYIFKSVFKNKKKHKKTDREHL